jgi:hypothetical protein
MEYVVRKYTAGEKGFHKTAWVLFPSNVAADVINSPVWAKFIKMVGYSPRTRIFFKINW